MNKESHPSTSPAESAVCPICHGEGELLQIDEEVGCQVRVPCWRCARVPSESTSDE